MLVDAAQRAGLVPLTEKDCIRQQLCLIYTGGKGS